MYNWYFGIIFIPPHDSKVTISPSLRPNIYPKNTKKAMNPQIHSLML